MQSQMILPLDTINIINSFLMSSNLSYDVLQDIKKHIVSKKMEIINLSDRNRYQKIMIIFIKNKFY